MSEKAKKELGWNPQKTSYEELIHIMATHDREMVDKMKKRVIQIDKGIIVRDDKKGGYDSEL